MFNREGKLDIFEDFRIDETLPKYTRPQAGSHKGKEDGEEEFGASDSLSMMKSSRPRRRQFMVTSGVGSNVVPHYDPEAKSWAETHADRAARRDPILFGVLAGRRQLYFVGEWIDEYCDLSLDQIADTLGRRPKDHIDPGNF